MGDARRVDKSELDRRNIKTALLLALVAVLILCAFVWSVSHK